MPQGHRSHELERESRRAFNCIMPSSWPVRNVDDEYGIDMEVEVIHDRQATGVLFQVQLKATDSEHLEDSRSIRVKRDTVAYWRAMDLPVLVVLYEASTKRLFACWAHGISMNVRPGRLPGETIRIPFPDDSQIDGTYHERLLDELNAVRAFRAREVPLPIPVRVMFDESNAVFGENEFLTRLRQLAERSRVVELQDMDGSSSASLFLRGGEVRFDLPAKLSTAVLYATPQDTTALRVAADALMMASVTLCAVGMDRDAVALAASVREESTISDSPQTIEALFRSYVSQGRTKEALALLLPLMESSDQELQTFADTLMTPLVQIIRHNLDDTDRELVQASLRRRALADAGTPHAGRTWYTIAQFNRRHPNFRKALEAMKRALECDPGYADRQYYYRDLAGILYDLGEYDESARNYSRALELGADASTAFLLADVLMLSGDFESARRAAEDAIDSKPPFGMQARLHIEALDHIITTTGLQRQVRLAWSNDEFASYVNSNGDIIDALRRSDALDPRLWTIALDRNENVEEALKALIVICISTTNIPDSWALAIVASVEARGPKEPLTVDLIDTAIRFVDAELYDALDRQLAEFQPDRARAVRDAVFDRGKYSRQLDSNTFRIFGPDGSYEEIELQP